MKVYLTNPVGLKNGLGGPRQRWLITVAPPTWLLQISDRICLAGCPPSADLMRATRAGLVPWAEYERRCRARWARGAAQLRPEVLRGYQAKAWLTNRHKLEVGRVWDGDTLLCVCATGKPCHRIWMADVLVSAGWEVVLDGRPLNPSEGGSP